MVGNKLESEFLSGRTAYCALARRAERSVLLVWEKTVVFIWKQCPG